MNHKETHRQKGADFLQGEFVRLKADGGTQNDLGPIKQEPVSKFRCAIYHSAPKLTRAQARERVLDALTNATKTLPPGETPESIAGRIQDVWVPRWIQEGSMTSEWRANGIMIERWTVTCTKCRGSGSVGRGAKKHNCSRCYGRGTEGREREKITPERGQTTATIPSEYADNYSGMVPFKFEATTLSDVVRLTDAQIRTLHCVAPCNFETGEQQSVLLHELSQKWRDRIRGSLRQSYDDVRSIVAVDGTLTLQTEISAFIYPAYVGWYAVGQKHRYVICDALTGEVRLPSKAGYYAKKAIRLLLVVAAAIAVLVGVLLVIGAIFGERNSRKSAMPPQNISRRAAETNAVSAAQSVTPATAITPAVESRHDLGQTQRSEATSVPVQNEPSASPAPFDCANASTMIERIVCRDTVLSNLDVALSENYDALLASPVDKAAYEALKDSQRKWITERDRCESSACLTTAYRARLGALCKHPASVGMGLVCGL